MAEHTGFNCVIGSYWMRLKIGYATVKQNVGLHSGHSGEENEEICDNPIIFRPE